MPSNMVLICIILLINNLQAQTINRGEDFDVLPGFRNPPIGYGEVPFYWWMGDTLTKERLLWQLDKISGKGVTSLQINYAHSDKGGIKWGLSYPSKPELFSNEWWDLFGWFMNEANKRGMAVSLSDYTLGLGQGSYVDEIITDDPALLGYELFFESKNAEEFSSFFWDLPNHWLTIKAYQLKDSTVIPGSGIDLQKYMSGRYLTWTVPKGSWLVACVYSKKKDYSLDPMNPGSGKAYIEKFFQRFEDRFPGESGKGLNFFFSDELDFNLYGFLWNKYFELEFEKRKGYSIIPELAGLFIDIGPRTVKIRLDYNDVMVSLSEEGFFKPLYEWQQERGMIYGCDHGGRGKDVLEFGDYFRTQKWNQGPGCDQPMLSQDVVKNKVASSISHLYQRPRTWLEGFHSSGWSTNSAELSEAIFANYMLGQNLLSLHGFYYSTHGGFWEWAPPCNHFRMPYYEHIKPLMKSVERLSYLLSQGLHQCDVAILYPVEPAAAKLDENTSVKTAFETGTYLYNKAIDFDYMDYESAARAEVAGDELRISGERYKVLIIPSMKAIRFSTVQKALEFFRSGGIIINIGSLPQASERSGSNDTELAAMIREIFGENGTVNTSKKNGKAVCLKDNIEAEEFIRQTLTRDFVILSDSSDKIVPRIQHRRIGNSDIYAVYNIPKGTECFFRAKGRAELWDPYTGETESLTPFKENKDGVFIRLPLEKTEVQLIVFNEGGGSNSSTTSISDKIYKSRKVLDGDWDFEIKPVLDNRWGDYHWPPSEEVIGPEVRRLMYSDETFSTTDLEKAVKDSSKWKAISNGFGPSFYKSGPVPDNAVDQAVKAILKNDFNVADSVQLPGKYLKWEEYIYSWKRGVENDPGHQGWHGLKEQISDDFIRLGKPQQEWTAIAYKKEESGNNYFLYTSVNASRIDEYEVLSGELKPASLWINGQNVNPLANSVKLNKGNNTLLIHYDQPGTTYFVLREKNDKRNISSGDEASLTMSWYGDNTILPFDVHPDVADPAGWYRFVSAPGLKRLDFAAIGNVKVWIDGKEYDAIKYGDRKDREYNYFVELKDAIAKPASVVIRIKQEPGFYAGAALPEPIKMKCERGKFQTGDWSRCDGLYSYSGGAIYSKSVFFSGDEINSNIQLDLGKVISSAEVFVNGNSAGVRLFPPYSFDISGLVKEGDNTISILIYNTAANHYTSIPTRYRGSVESGMMGPVVLEFSGIK